MKPVRGEVWLFDLGMTAKVRPALVVSVVRAIRKLGSLKREQFDMVFAGLLLWLGYSAG